MLQKVLLLTALSVFSNPAFLLSQDDPIPRAPQRSEGEGPFEGLILRGGILVDGTGAPPIGPVDIVIQGNRITEIKSVGFPGLPIKTGKRPELKEGYRELEIDGMYILPGFVDMHAHIGGKEQGTPAEYVFKLWMAHGITTAREVGSLNGLDWTLDQKRKSLSNEITAPRIFAYAWFGGALDASVSTPEEAREWVASVARQGADGLKLTSLRPDIMKATIDEAKKQGLL